MRPLTGLLATGTILGCLALHPASLQADEKKNNETVRFETVDSVELKGTFWPSTRGKKAPVALLLHKIGGKSTENGWVELAEDLQKAGFAVLSFDFRGHGASVGVGEQFWNQPMNRSLRRGSKPPATITHTEFPLSYLPNLVNDIAAAKRFLERRYNDPGECNLSNLVLIGAEDGATLGSLWLASETKRFRISQFGGTKSERPESKDVVACVWLNMSDAIGKQPVHKLLGAWLRMAGNSKSPESKIPMAFIFGKQDERAGTKALNLVKAIRPNYNPNPAMKGADDDLRGTVEFGVPETKEVGRKLLISPLDTRERIVKKYLDGFIFDEKKGLNEWEKHEGEKSLFAWYLPGLLKPVFTNMPGEKHLNPVPIQQFGLR